MSSIGTYGIYVLVLLFLVLTTQVIGQKTIVYGSSKKVLNVNILYFPVLLFLSFLIGFRFEVGVDWAGYVDIFNSISKDVEFAYSDQYHEFGFYLISWVFGSVLSFDHQWMFLVMAFISWAFYFRSVPVKILPLFLYFLFADEYFFWGMNGVRQFAAMAIWVFSVRYIVRRNAKKFALSMIAASMFHTSVLLLVPFYFIPYKKLYSLYLWIVIYCLSLMVVFFVDLSGFYQNIDLIVLSLGENVSTVERYARHAELGNIKAEETKLGLGFMFKIMVNFLIVLLSSNMLKRKPTLKPYMFFLFVGMIMFNLFYEFQIINRLTNYFLIFRSLVLAYLINDLWRYEIGRVISIALVFLYFIIFLAAINGNSNMCNPFTIRF